MVKIIDFYDFEKIYNGDVQEVTEFYNKYFPKSQHSVNYKKNIYTKPSTIILIAIDQKEVIGLLESWLDDDGNRLLSTIVIDEEYRNRGLFKNMFDRFKMLVREKKIILHFRESNLQTLEKVYKSIGFSNIKTIGTYRNGELKFEMSYDL
jgi:ribosomal protein S18 acetylase RimI-like enzyme